MSIQNSTKGKVQQVMKSVTCFNVSTKQLDRNRSHQWKSAVEARCCLLFRYSYCKRHTQCQWMWRVFQVELGCWLLNKSHVVCGQNRSTLLYVLVRVWLTNDVFSWFSVLDEHITSYHNKKCVNCNRTNTEAVILTLITIHHSQTETNYIWLPSRTNSISGGLYSLMYTPWLLFSPK